MHKRKERDKLSYTYFENGQKGKRVMLQLFTDTSANLPVALTKKYHITVIPFSYTVDGKETDYPDDTDFDGAAFYGAMRRGAIVKTSMVSPALMEEYYERALSAGDDVLYVGMSGGISGTAQAAAIAAGELTERYPERRIVTIDTYAASLGEGLQVLEAAEMIEEGKSLEEIKEQLLVRRPHMCQFFTVDDLAYLKRGGRISGATALIGTVLSIKPISAVALEMRPPRFKYARSSTVKNWHMCGLLERRYALISSKLFPSSIMRAASSTCNPSPREAA